MIQQIKKMFKFGVPIFLFISFLAPSQTLAEPKESKSFEDYYSEYFNKKITDFRDGDMPIYSRIETRLKLDELFDVRRELFLDEEEEDAVKSLVIRSSTYALNKIFEERISNLKENLLGYFNLEWVTSERDEPKSLYPKEESKFGIGKPDKFGLKFNEGLNASVKWDNVELLKRIDNEKWKIWYDEKIFSVNLKVSLGNSEDNFAPCNFTTGLYKEFRLKDRPLDLGLFSSFKEDENYVGVGFNYLFSF